jgi:hypothetical protein
MAGGRAGSGGANNPPSGGRSYQIGNVGAGARVQQGEHQTMIGDTLAALPDGDVLAQRFDSLIGRLREAPDIDEDARELAVEKTEAVAQGLATAQEEPGKLRRALLDAKQFLSGAVGWAWEELSGILESEAAQKTIATVAEAGIRASIKQLTGAP